MNTKFQSLIEKFNSYKYAKVMIGVILLIMIFLAYKIYIWANTQATDNAYIEADISSVSAEVNGIIEEVLVRENNIVEKDQIIAKIKDKDYRANLAKTESTLEGSRLDIEIIEQNIKLAKIEEQKTQEAHQYAVENFKIAEVDYKRTQTLSNDNYTSKKSLDTNKMTFEKAKTDLVQADFDMQKSKEDLSLLEIKHLAAAAKYNQVVAEVDLSKRALDNTNIRSPIKGMIGNSSLREGNYVRTGNVLFSVVPIDEFYIRANFKETQVSGFKQGLKAEITIDSQKKEKIIGTIRNISPATGSKFSLIPPSNATGNFTRIVQRVPVIIDFKTPDNIKSKIVPGMSALVEVRTD